YSHDKPNNKFKEILIFSDADDDGIHIICLILGLFKSKFPLLFDIIKIPILPSLICCNNYFIKEEDLILHKNNLKKKHDVIFCKGLGTYTTQELSHIILNKNLYFFTLQKDTKAIEYFSQIMGKLSEQRKILYFSEIE